MSPWEIAGAVLGTVCFLIWVPCMVSWIRRGASIPRYIHILAGVLTLAGIGCVIGLAAEGMATLGLVIGCIAGPPAATYFGWFWMFGPDLTS